MNKTASRKVLKVEGERDSAEVVDFKIIQQEANKQCAWMFVWPVFLHFCSSLNCILVNIDERFSHSSALSSSLKGKQEENWQTDKRELNQVTRG